MRKVNCTEEEKRLRRREEEGGFYETVHKKLALRRNPLKKQKKLKVKIRTAKDQYTFLQYLPLIYLWALKTKDLRRKDLDILFYLHPLIVFQSGQIIEAQKGHGFNDRQMMGRFKKGGWVKIYSKEGVKVYYTFTYKASGLISKIYRMLLMEEPLPMHYNNNSLVDKYDSRQNKKVMDTLNEFNRRVMKKAENKT